MGKHHRVLLPAVQLPLSQGGVLSMLLTPHCPAILGRSSLATNNVWLVWQEQPTIWPVLREYFIDNWRCRITPDGQLDASRIY